MNLPKHTNIKQGYLKFVLEDLFYVAGVDGCKGGWAVALASVTPPDAPSRSFCLLKLRELFVVNTFSQVLVRTKHCTLICVDIPIGLSNGPPRDCDVATRKLLGPSRASSVFPAPVRACLCATDYQQANSISRNVTGKGLSKQSFNLMDRIRQVDNVVTPALQQRVREIHPEIAFWALNGQKPLEYRKRIPEGKQERLKLLRRVSPDINGSLLQSGPPGTAADDILDAMVAAWTAAQTVSGNIETLPSAPKVDSKGLRMEIICPTI